MEFSIFRYEEMEPDLQYFTNVMRLSPIAFLLSQKAHAFPSEGILDLEQQISTNKAWIIRINLSKMSKRKGTKRENAEYMCND